jgi:hypothetical protein
MSLKEPLAGNDFAVKFAELKLGRVSTVKALERVGH